MPEVSSEHPDTDRLAKQYLTDGKKTTDGDKDYWHSAESNTDPNAWAKVIFKQRATIYRVHVTNRCGGNCCEERLTGGIVYIGQSADGTETQCGDPIPTTGACKDAVLECNIEGDYIVIRKKPSSHSLNIVELEAYTVQPPPPTPPPPATEYAPAHEYKQDARTCVSGYNMEKVPEQTVLECKQRCDKEPRCLAFEYGVDYGGSGPYKAGDCQMQNSSTHTAGCNGSYYNLDLYIKGAKGSLVRCRAACRTNGFTDCLDNTNAHYGSNQMLSCSHACMIRYQAEETEEECDSHCERQSQSGCSEQIGEVLFNLCTTCVPSVSSEVSPARTIIHSTVYASLPLVLCRTRTEAPAQCVGMLVTPPPPPLPSLC
jgi:hypothetical protein